MKCNNCGYDKIKPNQKTCPLCGQKIIPQEQVSTLSEQPITESQEISLPVEDPVELPQPLYHEQEPKQETSAFVMIECPRCGTRMQEDNNFCPRCGYNVRFQQENEEEQDFAPEPIEEEVVEEPPIEHHSEYTREEDTDQYIENGSYQPYPDDEEATPEAELQQTGSSTSSWLLTAILGIASILLGALLYFFIQS